MNIAEAKQIPLSEYVEYLGGRYSHTDRHGEKWYFSPFRIDESKASFKVNAQNTKWHDFGMSNTFAHINQGSGGDIIDLCCDYNIWDRSLRKSDALQVLAQFKPNAANLQRVEHKIALVKRVPQEPRYKILTIGNITFRGLKDELQRRRISLKLANLYLRQGNILDTVTQKKYIAFLFENDKGGFEVSIPNPSKGKCFKTCIGPKASTRFLVGDEVDSADKFEGFWDMLSWFMILNITLPRHHTYVLNSTSLAAEACQKIIDFKDNIKHVFLFFNNDEAGYQATHLVAGMLEKNDIAVGSREEIYKPHNDLSEFWSSNPSIKLNN